MNERLKEIAEQSGITFDSLGASYTSGSLLDFLERFADLIRADERDKCAQDYLQDCADAVEAARVEERKEIADWLMTGIRLDGLNNEPLVLQYTVDLIGEIAKLIRYRGEK